MLQEIIPAWTKVAEGRIISQYKAMGLKASGKFERDIETVVDYTAYGAKIQILGSAHSFQMINGRDRNSDQSPEGIRRFVGWAGNTWAKQWVKDKGLSISPFAVAYKIATKGVYVPNKYNSGALLDTAITDESLNELSSQLVGQTIEKMRSDVTNILIRK